MGLDYIQLLYTQPTENLPIIGLVSKENKTGKSTFGYWLKEIFKQNAVSIGNEELEGQFNALYASKLIIMVEEALVEKQKVMEKIKNQSTSPKIQLRQMAKDHVELDFFGKYIFTSNNETKFIYARKEDTRFWVRKVKTLEKEIPDFIKLLIDEIPAFLYYLENRILSTKKEGRMWFKDADIRTEAFLKVVNANKHRFEKIINEKMKELFIESGLEIIMMPFSYIKETIVGIKGTEKDSELKLIIEENLKLKKFENSKGKEDATWVLIPYLNNSGTLEFEKKRCRPYIFNKSNFLKAEDLENVQLSEGSEHLPNNTDDDVF
jgi:hypothetical protein